MRRLLAFLLFSTAAFAQSTTVSTTGVVDSNGTTWANGSYRIDFQTDPYHTPPQYTWSGGPFSLTYQGSLDTNGAFSISLPSNDAITPAGSKWKVTVCPNAAGSCYGSTFPVIGPTMDITSALNQAIKPPSFPSTPQQWGYGDNELLVPPNPGATYYNTTSGVTRCWTGSAWTTCSGTGGSSSVTYIAPSNDTTCAQDTTNIQSAITAAQSSGNVIQLGAGQFYINTLTINTNPISALRGVGQGTTLNYCGTTGNAFTIAAHTSLAGNVSTATPMVISDFALQQKSGVTPTAGIGFSIAGDGSGYLSGLHVERVSMNGLWQPLLLGSNLINDWFKDLFVTNCVSTVGMEYNIPVPGGDIFFDGGSFSSNSTAQACSIKIDQADTMEFTNLKLNGGAGVVFTRAGATRNVRFLNQSFEGTSNTPSCMVNFGTAGGNIPSHITFTGGGIGLTNYAFCNGANTGGPGDAVFSVDPITNIYTTNFGSGPSGASLFINNQIGQSSSYYASLVFDATFGGLYAGSSASPGFAMCSAVTGSKDCMTFLKGYGTTSEMLRVYDDTTGRGILDFLPTGLVQPETIFSAAGTALPTCTSALKGAAGTVSDASAPTYLGNYTSGGAVTASVVCNGSTWVTH